jgi:sortase A
MRRTARILSTLLIAGGVLVLAWTVLVWRWQDPVTALYTHWQQHKLAERLDRLEASYRPAPPKRDLAAERLALGRAADAFRQRAHAGEAIGRIVIGRIGLKMVLVEGTDHESLKKGPGRDPRTYMPGENRLVYIAGHRTTYLAPFSHIDEIRSGDFIRLELPYATFVYRASGHRVVADNDVSVLRSPAHEQLELQACHPRFFATHRYIVDADLVAFTPARSTVLYAAPRSRAA